MCKVANVGWPPTLPHGSTLIRFCSVHCCGAPSVLPLHRALAPLRIGLADPSPLRPPFRPASSLAHSTIFSRPSQALRIWHPRQDHLVSSAAGAPSLSISAYAASDIHAHPPRPAAISDRDLHVKPPT
ncbi:uncharacterized protein PAN0_019c5781 [Moesziomyces antarcticus]|uniref:Uncharacterized protein n=1 Tax=Pseudozyma antarctica TaxID=84753 RepID=A0A081CLK7_PSEA2|nr:uncharacterized protein PAN0_019c5781 [Moesziomyces antarcticus]GAK67553.1 hypothetical protein PAN0_019c5781 [Moesziomyces antarcticus]